MFLTQKVRTMGTKQRQVTDHRRICPNKISLWRTQAMSVSLGVGKTAVSWREVSVLGESLSWGEGLFLGGRSLSHGGLCPRGGLYPAEQMTSLST